MALSVFGLLVHIGGSLTHWEKANTQFANSVAFLTELATPLHPGLPAASRRSPDPTFRRRLISIDGRPGFRPSSPRFRQRQAGKQHGSVHEGPPGGNNGGEESGSRCPHQSFTSSGRELFLGSGLPHPTLQTPDRAPARASQARQGRRPVPTGRTKTFATSTPRQLPWSSSIFKLRAGTRLADPEPVERERMIRRANSVGGNVVQTNADGSCQFSVVAISCTPALAHVVRQLGKAPR